MLTAAELVSGHSFGLLFLYLLPCQQPPDTHLSAFRGKSNQLVVPKLEKDTRSGIEMLTNECGGNHHQVNFKRKSLSKKVAHVRETTL